MVDVLVIGQAARDLVLRVDNLPEPGRSAPVLERREMLGGKGANQAVALAQLGASVGLVATVGDDELGDWLLNQATADGIDVSTVARRWNVPSGLIVDLVDARASRRYLEDLPAAGELTEDDLAAAADSFAASRAVLIQLQQPAAVASVAASAGRAHGLLVVADGAPADGRTSVMANADVVRADAHEAELLAGRKIPDQATALRAAGEVLDQGPRFVVFAVHGLGNQFVWPHGNVFIPLPDDRVVDPTGAGDAFTAALTLALLRDADPEEAAQAAVDAAANSVARLGGRPDLPAELVDELVDDLVDEEN